MKNRFILITVIFAGLLLAGIYLMSKGMSDSDSNETQTPQGSAGSPTQEQQVEESLPKPTTDNAVTENQDRYVAFTTNSALESITSDKVLFFFANWCPTCIPVDKELVAMKAKLPQNITVVRVNYNDTETSKEEKDLAAKYGITYQHTFVLINNEGKVVKKWNGGGLDELLEKI